MKSCPKCSQTYIDETLNFCLIDGSPLSVVSEPPVEEQEVPTFIRSVSPSSKPQTTGIKRTLFIFMILAIPITLFPPYKWEDISRNSVICREDVPKKAEEVLPFKQYSFVFGDDQGDFGYLCKDWRRGGYVSSKLILYRKLIPVEWTIEYILALIAAFFIQTIIWKIFFRRH